MNLPFMSSNIPSAPAYDAMHLNAFGVPIVVRVMVTFCHATRHWWQDFVTCLQNGSLSNTF